MVWAGAAVCAYSFGFPLTMYGLSDWLHRRYPGLDLLSHDAGHLWDTLLGWQGDPHLNPLHLLSNVLIAVGFILLAQSWPVLYAAQQRRELATTSPYAHVRYPRYVAFIVIVLGFRLRWPPLLRVRRGESCRTLDATTRRDGVMSGLTRRYLLRPAAAAAEAEINRRERAPAARIEGKERAL